VLLHWWESETQKFGFGLCEEILKPIVHLNWMSVLRRLILGVDYFVF